MVDTAKSGRDQAAEIKRQAELKQRRRTFMIYGGGLVVVAVLIALAAIGIRDSSKDNATPSNVDLGSASGLGAASSPPWSLPLDVPTRVKAAGLNLGAMGTADHYHAHLAIIIDGQNVTVPEGIGIDPTNGAMSAVHTHSSDGVIHIEAGTKGEPFTIGQLFTEWNVRLTSTQVGSARVGDGNVLKAYVNGKVLTGNPSMIRLAEKKDIAIVFGQEDSNKPPASFTFPDDL